MADLPDYSGEFITEIKYDDFSKDVLLRMLDVFAKEIMLVDGLWRSQVARVHSEDEAWNFSKAVWEKLAEYDPRAVAKALGIVGNDLASFMKINQWFGTFWPTMFPRKIELKDNNHGVVTCVDCASLKHFEKLGDEEGIRRCCQEMECYIWEKYAKSINPKIEFTPLKMPPRTSPDGRADIGNDRGRSFVRGR